MYHFIIHAHIYEHMVLVNNFKTKHSFYNNF